MRISFAFTDTHHTRSNWCTTWCTTGAQDHSDSTYAQVKRCIGGGAPVLVRDLVHHWCTRSIKSTYSQVKRWCRGGAPVVHGWCGVAPYVVDGGSPPDTPPDTPVPDPTRHGEVTFLPVGATVCSVGDMRTLSARGVRARLARRAAWVTEGWVTRDEAQRRLGLGRARVDYLRRIGVLHSERNPRTGAVRVCERSVERELRRRRAAGA